MVIIGVIRLDLRLHTHKYFFLSSLSFLDICYAWHAAQPDVWHRAISYIGCKGQMYMALSCGINECLLLAVMAYDCYMVVCLPLHYMEVMSLRACITLVACSWLVGLLLSVVPIFSLSVPF
ncbi:olfactory receptor 13-like [Mauremys reevesii]|uniref:olfactory receptor 13-like n=1 Tax=Mauremys reevesii TaxID=260615 RepID=UPI00193F835D|nr:olfactory receptor 13-like [Mauremys reevesii]